MTAALHQMARDAVNRARMAIGRGVLSLINDVPQAQELQLELLDGETADQIEHFQHYGFTSVPFASAEAVMVGVGGLRSHGIVIATVDRRYRLTGGQPGEVAIHDDQGQQVALRRDGVEILSPDGKLTVTVGGDGTITISGAGKIVCDDLSLGDSGGPAVARVGDSVDLSTGKIISGSDKVTCA